MIDEDKKLDRAIEIMKSLTEGINPFTNELNEENALINDPRMVRCLYYVVEVLEKYKAGNIVKFVQTKDLPYSFPKEIMEKVKLTVDKIGVNTFAKCVNEVTDPTSCKRLTGTVLNSQLKKMGILSEVEETDGKHHTSINDKSELYGIESITVDFNGNAYEKVVFNEKGKKYLLEHLQEIIDFKDPMKSLSES